MSDSIAFWQHAADAVMARFKRNFLEAGSRASGEARLSIMSLSHVERVRIADLGERGFIFDREASSLTLGIGGLNLVLEQGIERGFDGLELNTFCEIALALYLFHEWHHVGQGLADFADVQALKQTAGPDKLGELDLSADAISAQIFALIEAAEIDSDWQYAANFLSALRFMIRFCFPAFKFPRSRRHKVQRALGIVLMAITTERAIQSGNTRTAFDTPLYPAFSGDYSEMTLLSYGGGPSQSVVRVARKLSPASIVELLDLIDKGDVEGVLRRARVLA